MKKFLQEFKKFALRGNVIDLAVGVIIGAAFQAIVNSLVNDVVSPIIGILLKGNLNGKFITIRGAQLQYGSFLTAIINFIITALVIFLFIKLLNSLSDIGKKLVHKEDEEVILPTTKNCPYCCSEISIEASRCPHCTSNLEK